MSNNETILMLPGLILGLTVHEFAHAWSASLLGDGFPRRQGRVSLNPLRHMSPSGTLAVLLLMFGWAKPVMVNVFNFKHPKRDYLVAGLAGPLANIVMATACIGLMHLTNRVGMHQPAPGFVLDLTHRVLRYAVLINVILAVLNLLPIPPLDGSKIWPCIIPGLKPVSGGPVTGFIIILFIVLMFAGVLSPMFGFVVDEVTTIMPADLP
jgi:Zn-dependent protease